MVLNIPAGAMLLLILSVAANTSICLAQGTNQGSLQLENSQYFRASEAYYRDGATASMTSWRLGWAGEARARKLFAMANVRNDYHAEEDHHYIKPFEAAVGWRSERAELSLGRQRKLWSQADELWRLGTWQPRFMDDRLTRETAGLTGAFFQTSSSKIKFMALASPIYIPEMGADFEVEDRSFVSKNPWFTPPTRYVNLKDNLTAVYYDINKPPVEEVIFQGTAGAQIEFRPRETRFLRLSAAYKPMNQILVGAPIKLHLQAPNYATVVVQPRVVYHQVVTTDFGVQNENGLSAWASYTLDRPIRDNPPEEWTTQEVDKAHIASAYLGYDVRGEGEYASHVFASYLNIQGGEAPDGGEIVGKKSFFDSRYMFTDAVQLGFRHGTPWLSRRWLTFMTSSFIYDFAQRGLVFSTNFRQRMSKYWSANLNADFIGLTDQSGRVSDGFISTFRANDRVSLGVEYVF